MENQKLKRIERCRKVTANKQDGENVHDFGTQEYGDRERQREKDNLTTSLMIKK